MVCGVILLLFIIYGFGYIIASVAENIENDQCKKTSANFKTGTYIDRVGAERSLKDNSYLSTIRDGHGDIVQMNKYGEIVRNFSEEERKAIPGTVTELTDPPFDKLQAKYGVCGCKYQDRQTGEIYAIRDFQSSKYGRQSFYMSIKTGKFIRPADHQLLIEEECKRQNKIYCDNSEFDKIICNLNSMKRNTNSIPEFYLNDDEHVGKAIKPENIAIYVSHRKGIDNE